ncbi:3-deoxy-manno-octulosonate cytidylyltransferase [Burkholderiales bacterium]|nr:3-deoxy-manno-octulosonate cytidylyltransferase [Burkholderiales bacterium]
MPASPPPRPARLPQPRFWALIPARLASTRLPDKPLAEIAGVPMVVHVARRAAASGAERVVVCADSARIVDACRGHAIEAILTRESHPTGTDRLAEACQLLGLEPEAIVVNVQGDEPLMPPEVIAQVAGALAAEPQCDLATAAHRLHDAAEFFDPNVVKVVTDARGRALLFSRAPIPWSREAFARSRALLPPELPALRHVGLYAYRVRYLLRFPTLARPAIEEHESLEQLRALYHGSAIAVMPLAAALPPGVDTPADLERARAAIAAAGDGASRERP